MVSKHIALYAGMIVLLIGALAASAQAYTVDGSIFDDEFNGDTLNPALWSSFTQGTGSATVGGGAVTVQTIHPGDNTARVYNPSDMLDYSSSPDDWWVECRFKMVGYLDDYLRDVPEWAPFTRSWLVLTGEAGGFIIRGFDIRALEHTKDQHTETVFDLGWYGNDNTGGGGSGSAGTDRMPTVIYENLNKDEFYVLNLHRKSDGNIDIYLNNNLIATETLIENTNPLRLTFGDAAKAEVGGTEVIDYVRVGAVVPEPGTLLLLATGLFGLLCYAWRKRK